MGNGHERERTPPGSRKYRVALINPPGLDPRGPRLALPSLGAYLRRQGVSTLLVDLDLSSLVALLDSASLARAGVAVRERARPHGDIADPATRLALVSESLPETVPAALRTLRCPALFFDPAWLAAARDTILDAMDVVSAASARGVHYSVEPLRYEVDGVDATRFADLARVTADREANLFADHWEADLLPVLKRSDVEVVGISLLSRFQLIPCLMLARWLRALGYFVVIGGSLVPRFAERLARLPEFFDLFADGVVTGEGETAIVEIVAQLDARRDFSRVPNLLYPQDGQARFTRPHLEDLATLPTPDFTGLPLDDYLAPVRVLPLLIGRGCYHAQCKFCEIPHNNRVSAVPYRTRPLERVVADVLDLASRFDCRHFVIGDESVWPEDMERIADGLASGGRHDLRFVAYARFEAGFTATRCRRLAEMGLRRVLLGLESGSQQMLDHMRKGICIEEVRPILENFRDANITFTVFAMVGLPEETEDLARLTFRFFEQNADLFDRPGNVCDIRSMELQVSTAYMAEARALGLRIPSHLLAGDFVVGVGERWENTRGLSRSDTSRVLAEGHRRLDAVFDRARSGPSPLWPPWDEWALLYADHFRQRAFPHRLALPEDGDAEVALRWNPSMMTRAAGNSVLLATRRHALALRRGAYDAFARAGVGTPAQLLARLAGGAPPSIELAGAIRAMITLLAKADLLQIVQATGATPAGNPR